MKHLKYFENYDPKQIVYGNPDIEYNIGDYIRLASDNFKDHIARNSKIVDISNDRVPYLVEFENGQDMWCSYQAILRFLTEKEIEEYEIKKMQKFIIYSFSIIIYISEFKFNDNH